MCEDKPLLKLASCTGAASRLARRSYDILRPWPWFSVCISQCLHRMTSGHKPTLFFRLTKVCGSAMHSRPQLLGQLQICPPHSNGLPTLGASLSPLTTTRHANIHVIRYYKSSRAHFPENACYPGRGLYERTRHGSTLLTRQHL